MMIKALRFGALVAAVAATLALAASPARAVSLPADARIESPGGHRSLDIGINNIGISLGNSARWRGLRINLVDRDVDRVTGINLTLWRPGENRSAVMHGIQLGLVAPNASELHGISVGGLAVIAEKRMTGISVAGLAVISDGAARGLSFGGLASICDGNQNGISFGGLASICDGNQLGISMGGLADITDGSRSGLGVGGLATICDGNAQGINVGGLATICEGTQSGIAIACLSNIASRGLRGLAVAGLANVVDGDLAGLCAGGLGNVASGASRGISIAGVSIRAGDIVGEAVAGGYIRARRLDGFSAAAVNRFDEYQAGISIGIVNYAGSLNGIQLGLINIARNNRAPFKVLPILNVHLE